MHAWSLRVERRDVRCARMSEWFSSPSYLLYCMRMSNSQSFGAETSGWLRLGWVWMIVCILSALAFPAISGVRSVSRRYLLWLCRVAILDWYIARPVANDPLRSWRWSCCNPPGKDWLHVVLYCTQRISAHLQCAGYICIYIIVLSDRKTVGVVVQDRGLSSFRAGYTRVSSPT
jgi:hypothetical protein